MSETKPQCRWKIKDQIKDRYEIFDIKFGGMGVVYLCFDHVFKKPVVLKSLQDKYLTNKSLSDRFMWEAEIWVRLEKHQNIVRAEYINKIDDLPYIFMEYIVGDEQYGSDLKGWIVNGGLDLARSINFGIQFCSGMIYAASKFKEMNRPFVYRDIKPSNLMVTREAVLKITDFGLVKLSGVIDMSSRGTLQRAPTEALSHDFEKTKIGSIMGTPPYMAPEQWSGGDVDHRADIYSFGCVLYEMIKGRPPFLCQSLSDYKFNHREADVPPLPNVPNIINLLISRCLEKRKEARYQSFNKIKEDLITIYQKISAGSYVENDINQSHDLEIWELENKGISLFNLGYKKEAINCYNEVIIKKPDYAQAYHDRGIALKSLGQVSEAINDYDKAIQLKSDNSSAYYNRGIALHSMGKIKDAIKDFDSALHYKPNYIKALYNRAIACRADGQYEKAVNDLTMVIDKNKKNAKAYYNRGICNFALRRFEDAVEDYQAALTINPGYCEAQYNLCLTYLEMPKHILALSGFQQYIEMAHSVPSQKQWVEKARAHIEVLVNKDSKEDED
ncbi:MAG: tetratricopeptide repeat protein [Nitrospirae bacterium]|nr:tetratricopeptide repeat protein [Nitrospirota bacterium]